MKTELSKILHTLKPDTTIEKVLSYCDSIKDFDTIVKSFTAIAPQAVAIFDLLNAQ